MMKTELFAPQQKKGRRVTIFLWGCKWFAGWVRNVQESVENGHRLLVYFFEEQVGEGKVSWSDVTEASLMRDAVLARQSD